MSDVQLSQSNTEAAPTPATFLALAEQAAASLRPYMQSADVVGYRSFLNSMYHYTRFSGQKALKAQQDSQTPELKKFFAHLYKEENGHHILAEADLRELGLGVCEETPEAILTFNRWWDSIGPRNSAAYVGALVVFENIAQFAGADAMGMVKRLNMTKKQARWIYVHVEADEHHGKEALEAAEPCFTSDPKSLREGAEMAARLWADIFIGAFKNPVVVPSLPV